MTFGGQVKCVLIDPPYNTGEKDFLDNDNYVDRDDLWRHSKWLEFMFQRLTLARDLLSQDGVIFIHIGEEEVNRLGCLMDGIMPGRKVGTCPLPVLGLCLWLVFSVLGMLVLSFVKFGVTPFFGVFLTGVPETIFYLAIATLWGYAAWLLYHLDERGWWLILIAICVLSVSGILTFARHDILEMYRLMNYPEAQIQQIQKSGLLVGNNMTWLMVFSLVPFLGYILFIKRYFGRKA
jgi:DNA methylase